VAVLDNDSAKTADFAAGADVGWPLGCSNGRAGIGVKSVRRGKCGAEGGLGPGLSPAAWGRSTADCWAATWAAGSVAERDVLRAGLSAAERDVSRAGLSAAERVVLRAGTSAAVSVALTAGRWGESAGSSNGGKVDECIEARRIEAHRIGAGLLRRLLGGLCCGLL